MLCGKIAAGKSTLAARLAAEGAVGIAEDVWLSALFADHMQSGAAYMHDSAKLRSVLGQHVIALLRAGLSGCWIFRPIRWRAGPGCGI